jgi:hypothetical protein
MLLQRDAYGRKIEALFDIGDYRYVVTTLLFGAKVATVANTVGHARTNVIGSRTSFVVAYVQVNVVRGNPFQAHSLEQSYHSPQPFKQEKIIQNQKCVK